MTFAEFQATRRYCADLGKAIADARWQGEPPAKGNLYLDGTLYIEEVQAHWPRQLPMDKQLRVDWTAFRSVVTMPEDGCG